MRTRIRNERGTALLETAITIPIILLISVAIFEFGRAYQVQQVLTNGAREGARLAVIEGVTDDQVKARVRQYLTDGGLVAVNPIVERMVPFGSAASASRVTINFPFNFIVLNPVVRLIAPNSTTGAPVTMHAVSLMRNE